MAGIKATITLEGDQAIKTLKALNKGLDSFGKSGDTSVKKVNSSLEVMKGTLGAIGAIRAFDFLKQQAIEAVRTFAEFESGLVGVAKTANLSEAEVNKLAQNVRNLTKVIPASSKELLDIAESAGQLGVTGVGNITLFSETIAKLGRVTNIEGGEAATSLTRILNISRESIGSIDKLASVIVALGNNFAASESDIVAVTNEVARASAQFGVSSAESAALSTALKSIGVRAEEAGGVINRAFQAIEGAVKSGGKELKQLQRITGLTGDELKKRFAEDAIGTFQVFIEGLQRLKKENAVTKDELAKLGLEGVRINNVLPNLAANSDMFARALVLANKEVKNATALNAEFEKTLVTTENQMQLLSNAVDRAQERIGQKLASALTSVTPLLIDFLDRIGKSQEDIFIETTDNVQALEKELGILQNRVRAINADGKVSFWEEDPEEIQADIEAIKTKLDSLKTENAKSEIQSLNAELAQIRESKESPLLQSVFGTPEELDAREKDVLARIENIKKAEAMQGKGVAEESGAGTSQEDEEAKRQAELEAKQAAADREIEIEQNKINAIRDLKATRAQEEMEAKEAEKLAKELEDDEEFQRLEENLGREAASRELYRIQEQERRDLDKAKEIQDEEKRAEAIKKARARRNTDLKKLNDKARDQEKQSIFAFRKFEDLTAQEKIAYQKQTLSTIATLQNSSNSTLFAVGKAAAISNAGINIAEGLTKALAAFPPPFNFAAAAAVGAAGAVQLANIAKAKPPPKNTGSFQDGGLVEGTSFTGDRLTANVNSGELIINRRQQTELFNAINAGSFGSDRPPLNINIEAGVGGISDEQIDRLIDSINDRTEFGNKELRAV